MVEFDESVDMYIRGTDLCVSWIETNGAKQWIVRREYFGGYYLSNVDPNMWYGHCGELTHSG